jgi:hypothetical protein
VIKRSTTDGRVTVGFGVVKERCITVGRVSVAVDVIRERIGASGTVKKPDGVAIDRINACSGVVTAIDIAKQGAKTRRRILVATGEGVKRLKTSAGVPDPSRAVHQHPNSFPIVGAGYGAIRVGPHRLHFWQKRKTDN